MQTIKPRVTDVWWTKKRVTEKDIQIAANEIKAHFPKAYLFNEANGAPYLRNKKKKLRSDDKFIKTL